MPAAKSSKKASSKKGPTKPEKGKVPSRKPNKSVSRVKVAKESTDMVAHPKSSLGMKVAPARSRSTSRAPSGKKSSKDEREALREKLREKFAEELMALDSESEPEVVGGGTGEEPSG